MSLPAIPGRNPLAHEGYEKIAQFKARGFSHKEAARKSGFSPSAASVTQILKFHPEVLERIRFLRRTIPDMSPEERARADLAEGKLIDPDLKSADDIGFTVAKQIADLDRLAKLAEEDGNLSVALKCRATIAELSGARKKITESTYVGARERKERADAKAKAEREATQPAPQPQTPNPHLATLLAEEQRKQAEATARVKAREAEASAQ